MIIIMIELPKIINRDMLDLIFYIENQLSESEKKQLIKYLFGIIDKSKITYQCIDKIKVAFRFDVSQVNIDNIIKVLSKFKD